MTESEAGEFVERFAASRSKGRGGELWHPHGVLHYPFANRVIHGHELGALNDRTAKVSPNLTWAMTGWTHRGNVIVVEWFCTNRYGEHVMEFAGVDKLILQDGKIIEEVVYADTAPLQAMKLGIKLEALNQLPPSL